MEGSDSVGATVDSVSVWARRIEDAMIVELLPHGNEAAERLPPIPEKLGMVLLQPVQDQVP